MMTCNSFVVVQLCRLLLGILVAAAALAHAFTHRHHHPHVHVHSLCAPFPLPTAPMKTAHKTAILPTCLLNYKNDQEGTRKIDNSSTSIGDVVQNLHGGKYQFSETQYLAGGSVTGQQFAESLYSGAGDDDNVIINDEDEELPKWALRLKDPIEQADLVLDSTLLFDEQNLVHTITIKNNERSWEKYYAFVLHPNDNDDGPGCCFRVSPTTGSLAPRGGASNVCDETKPYSDSAKVDIEWVIRGGRSSSTDAVVVVGESESLLVVGTEAEVWRYRLTIQ